MEELHVDLDPGRGGQRRGARSGADQHRAAFQPRSVGEAAAPSSTAATSARRIATPLASACRARRMRRLPPAGSSSPSAQWCVAASDGIRAAIPRASSGRPSAPSGCRTARSRRRSRRAVRRRPGPPCRAAGPRPAPPPSAASRRPPQARARTAGAGRGQSRRSGRGRRTSPRPSRVAASTTVARAAARQLVRRSQARRFRRRRRSRPSPGSRLPMMAGRCATRPAWRQRADLWAGSRGARGPAGGDRGSHRGARRQISRRTCTRST